METAIHKMTGRTAAVFGMADRGVLQPGAFADLVLFDPATVIESARRVEHSTRISEGIEQVWANGVPTYRGGKATGEKPGRLVSRNR